MKRVTGGRLYIKRLLFVIPLVPALLAFTLIGIYGFNTVTPCHWWSIGLAASSTSILSYWIYRKVILMEETLKRALSDKERFLTMVSHDLKTPLSSIIMSADIGLNNEKSASDMFKLILRQGHSMLNLTNDLLLSSAAQAGQLQLKKTEVLISDVLANILSSLSSQIKKQGVNITSDVGGIKCVCDRDRLEQILTNLLSNSLKHTVIGGCVAVKATQQDDGILFMVSDTGGGIPKEKLKSIFEAYQTLGENSGHGLGLTIVKYLVEAHGGIVWIESVIGTGTKTFFTIPQSPRKIQNIKN